MKYFKENVRLKDFIDTQKGYAFKSKWYTDEGIQIVKVSDFTSDSIDTSNLVSIPPNIADKYKKYKLTTGDVIVQTVGSWPSNPASVVGKVIKVPRDANNTLLNQNAVKLIPNGEIDNRYLFYLLKSPAFKEYIVGTAQGAASQASITLDSIRGFKFDLPIISVQKKIASILFSFDDLIENNTHRIEILEEMARRIYREWFVHFRYPGHEKDKLVDSGTELGEIPKGWEVEKLENVIDLQYGKGLRKKDRVEGDYPLYGSSGIIDWHNNYHVDGPGIIVGRKGNIGSVFWEFEHFNPIDTTYYVVTDLPLTYVFYNLQNQNFINNDAAVPGLSKRQANSLPVLIPESQLLAKFDDEIIQLFNLKRILEQKNQKLKETRDLLLPRLISGKIKVEELTIN